MSTLRRRGDGRVATRRWEFGNSRHVPYVDNSRRVFYVRDDVQGAQHVRENGRSIICRDKARFVETDVFIEWGRYGQPYEIYIAGAAKSGIAACVNFASSAAEAIEKATGYIIPTKEEDGLTIKIKVENTYEDGHESERLALVEEPPSSEPADVDDWWENTVRDETGDGHGVGNTLGYCYTVTVLDAPDHPELVGRSREWSGR